MFGSKKDDPVYKERFERLSFDLIEGIVHTVVKDKETGVLYYLANGIYGIGLTPLLDSKGQVMVESLE